MPTAGPVVQHAPRTPAREEPRLAVGVVQILAWLFFAVSMLLSGALAVALVYLAFHPSALGTESAAGSLGITVRIALVAVVSWIPTIALLHLLGRRRQPLPHS